MLVNGGGGGMGEAKQHDDGEYSEPHTAKAHTTHAHRHTHRHKQTHRHALL